LRIEIGIEGGESLLTHGVHSYGRHDDNLRNRRTVTHTFPIPGEAGTTLNIAQNKRLYIKFRAETNADTYFWGAPFGTIAWFEGNQNTTGETTVYFNYNGSAWVSSSNQSSVSFNTSSTASGITFTHTHNITYSVTIK